jgi:N-methylhydantoinase A
VSVPLASGDPATMLPRLYEDFLHAHERIYGHSSREPARIVNLRSVHGIEAGFVQEAGGLPVGRPDEAGGQPGRTRSIRLPGTQAAVEARIIDRAGLAPGERFTGPALIEQIDTTTLVPIGWTGEVASSGELILRRLAT